MKCVNCGADLTRRRGSTTTWYDDAGGTVCDKNEVEVMGLLHVKGAHIPNLPVSATTVEVTVEGGRYELTEKEVWPDGVSPHLEGFWSAETLAASVGLEYSSVASFLDSWDMASDLSVTFIDDQGRSAMVKFGR